jgi:hypothetical protein
MLNCSFQAFLLPMTETKAEIRGLLLAQVFETA